MRVMIAGGGTGGHVYPGIALAREFQRQTIGTEILFVGTEKGLEARVLPREGFQLGTIRVRGLIGKGWARGLSTLLRIPISCWDAARMISRFKPDLIIGSGGYASGPVILMAWLMRKKRVILEINLMPGFTNRFLSPLSDLVVVAWEGSKAYLSGKRIRLLGSPVRRELIAAGSGPPSNTTKKTVVLLGGSQGAHALNIAMLEAIDHFGFFTDEIEIIHQTGREDYDSVREAYAKKGIRARVELFIEDMGAVYRQATVLISRAGATTVAEITACGKPSILIPFPHAAGGHQELNARALEAEGAALMVLQEDLSGPLLAQLIIDLLRDTEKLERMSQASRRIGRPDAAEKIVEACLELVGEK
jgi:UDP-N-acetylglucosamine--N-acetylmuramyl-(pentapeptide) pyrophosphoryl-undecaprenol N-acetylglucosamine transferase